MCKAISSFLWVKQRARASLPDGRVLCLVQGLQRKGNLSLPADFNESSFVFSQAQEPFTCFLDVSERDFVCELLLSWCVCRGRRV